MQNTDTLLQILNSARKIGNEVIAKEAVRAIAEEYGIASPTRYASLKDIRLYTFIAPANRITAIKELRERAMENGLAYGLKEAKEEVDRRIAEATASESYFQDVREWEDEQERQGNRW